MNVWTSLLLLAVSLVTPFAMAAHPQEWMKASSPDGLFVYVKTENCPGDSDEYQLKATRALTAAGIRPLS